MDKLCPLKFEKGTAKTFAGAECNPKCAWFIEDQCAITRIAIKLSGLKKKQ